MTQGGVYQILNTSNGKRYIGSAVSFRLRFATHRHHLKTQKHCNKILQNSWNKHGHSAFEFTKLLICSPKDLLFYEQRAIDSYKPEYNICPTAGSALGRKHSAETKAKISLANMGNKCAVGNKSSLGYRHTEEAKIKIGAAAKGKKLSIEHRAKMSAGRAGIAMTPEWQAKISASNKGRVISAASRAKASATMTGRVAPVEARANMAIAQKGRVVTPAHRAAISATKKGVPWSVARRAAQRAK